MARNRPRVASARLTATCCRAGGSRWPVWRLRGSGPCRLCEIEGSRVGVDSPRSRLVDRLPLLVLRPGHIPRRLPHSALSGGGDDSSKHSRTLPSPLRIVAARQESSAAFHGSTSPGTPPARQPAPPCAPESSLRQIYPGRADLFHRCILPCCGVVPASALAHFGAVGRGRPSHRFAEYNSATEFVLGRTPKKYY